MSSPGKQILFIINQFMSKYQICILGVQKFSKEKQVVKQLQQILGDNYNAPYQIVKPKLKPFCFLSFDSEEAKQQFCQLISDSQDQSLRVGEVHNSKAFEKQLQKKQKREQHQEEFIKLKNDSFREPFERNPNELALQTAPLHQLSYDEQIALKVNDLKLMLQKFLSQLKKKIPSDNYLPAWISEQELKQQRSASSIELNLPLLCKEKFRTAYRNKSEFTIGYNSKNEVCVGYNVGSHLKNDDSVERPNTCIITPKLAIEVANLFEGYIKSSTYLPFNRIKGSGVWRLLSVRKSDRTKQFIIAVSLNKNNISDNDFSTIQVKLRELFLGYKSEYTLVGIILMNATELGQDLPSKLEDTVTIFGQNYYEEVILDKRIRISYNAFVQNHIEQCESMYRELKHFCEKKAISKFLDICAGSGTIGISVSESVKSVLAIEMNEQSCNDALENYKLNGVQNCRILCSKVEDVIKQEVAILKSEKHNILACLDPPRAGVIQSVIESLRTCKGLDQILYVSCSPYSVIDNLVYLCTPMSKKYRAPGFKLRSATLVDMFPQTNHFETIFFLERDYGFEIQEEI